MKNTLLIITIIFFLILSYFIIPIFYVESYFPLNPYIDTKFSQNFKSENFEKIKFGMTKKEVEKILGKPLIYSDKIISSIQPENTNISVYSSDGKSNWGDFALEIF